MSIREVGAIWVCTDCIMHYSNGECGGCHSDHGHDSDPLGLVEDFSRIASGITSEAHAEDCDRPGEYPCDCEYTNYSTSSCEGCGSTLHGERHAMTLFEYAKTL